MKAVDGRFANKKIGRTNFRLLLSKNPASWRETLATSKLGPSDVLLVVNANTQDGKDTSWLWDVDYRPLLGKDVICTGDRRLDIAYRLSVQGCKVRVAGTFKEAVEHTIEVADSIKGLELSYDQHAFESCEGYISNGKKVGIDW